MKTKLYHFCLALTAIGVLTGLMMILLPLEADNVVETLKGAATRWGQLRAIDMTLSDLVGVMLIGYILLSMLKSKSNDKN